MDSDSRAARWRSIASHIVEGLDLRADALVYVHALPAGCDEALAALLEAAGRRHVTAYVEADDPAALAERIDRMKEAHAVLAFDTGAGIRPAAETRQAMAAVIAIEESRGLPFILCAVPTEARTSAAKRSLAEVEDAVLAAIDLDRATIQSVIDPVLRRARAGETLTIRTPNDCVLTASTRGRIWHADDGIIDAEDRRNGAIVSNLPAGSIYTAVVEESAAGTLWVPRMLDAVDVTLHFVAGRVHAIEGSGARELERFLDSHSGEPRRIGHIGLGLNPRLTTPLGWTLIDEHVGGAAFVSFGENRYMGGANASSLNLDVALSGARLLVAGEDLWPA